MYRWGLVKVTLLVITSFVWLTCLLTARPIEMQVNGNLWTKLVVPSMGSMIQVGLSVNSHFSPAATDSSPMKLKENAYMFF